MMIFITGTDTGVGKTYISSIIGKHLKYKENKNIGYMKPIESGGVCVPIKDNFLMSDLIKFLNLPTVVVSRPNLGTINHTILTVE